MSAPPSGQAPTDHRVVLYGRAGCHLCDEARDTVNAVCTGAGVAWVEVDVDDPAAGPEVLEKYGDYVPVVTVDGVQQGFWNVDPARLASAISRGRGIQSVTDLG